jgi:hypothetical protein
MPGGLNVATLDGVRYSDIVSGAYYAVRNNHYTFVTSYWASIGFLEISRHQQLSNSWIQAPLEGRRVTGFDSIMDITPRVALDKDDTFSYNTNTY